MLTSLNSSSATTQKVRFSFWRIVLYVFLVLVLLVVMVFGGLYTYLKMYPDAVSQRISQELKKNIGVEASFSAVNVTVFPMPALSFVDVRLIQENFTLDVAYATVTPSLWDIIDGNYSLGHISLWRPILHWKQAEASQNGQEESFVFSSEKQKIDLSFSELTQSLQNELHTYVRNIPSYLFGSFLDIKHGKVVFEQQTMLLQCENVQSSFILGPLGYVKGNFGVASLQVLLNEKPYARLKNSMFLLSGDVHETLHATVQTELSMAEYIRQGKMTLTASYTLPLVGDAANKDFFSAKTAALENVSLLKFYWDVQTQLFWQGADLAVHSRGALEGDIQDSIIFKDVRTQISEDVAVLNASLSMKGDRESGNNTKPVLKGSLAVEQLSLPQWFSFARQLPLGIQNTLDNLKGTLHFELDAQGLEVHSLEAVAAFAHFTGKGGVKQWSKPVIFLDIESNELQLKDVYPEIEGKQAQALHWAQPPLVPLSDKTNLHDSHENTVGYDIRISTKKLLAWDLPMESMSFRCSPAGQDGEKIPQKYEDAVVLEFGSENFYDGRAEAKVVLYSLATKESAYDITGILRNIRATPVQRLLGRKLFDGRISADTTFTATGSTLKDFLLSKNGMAALRVDSGRFYGNSGETVPFSRFTLASDFSARTKDKAQGAALPSHIMYNGQWNTSLQMQGMSAKASWNGAVELAGENYSTILLRNIPARVNLSLDPDLTGISSNFVADIDGKFSLNTKLQEFSVNAAHISVPNFGSLQLTGSGMLDMSEDLSWAAQLQGSTASLSELLWRVNAQGQAWLPVHFPQRVTGSVKLAYAKDTLRLDALNLRAHTMHLQGNVRRSFSQKSAWNFDLALNAFDYDTFFAGSNKGKSGAQGASGTKAANSWDWLKKLRAEGEVRLKSLRVKKLHIRNVNIPIKIENSRIVSKPIRGTLYEGSLKASFDGRLHNAILQSHIIAETHGVNLFALTQDLGMSTALSGPAQLSLSLKGPLLANFLAGLEGTWSVQVGRGFMQSRDARGNLSGKPTYITSFSDNGTLIRGILQSQRFALHGADIAVVGNGHLDLLQNTLDMRLVADVGKVVDIPVRYYGALDNPKRDLDDGAVILATIGTLGTGVFDLIGGIFDILFGTF